jgi:hypothetical protein
LVHEDSPVLVAKHLKVIANKAISVLLLPSLDPAEHIETIITRQLQRYPEVDPEKERNRYIERHQKYKNYGDIQIIGVQEPINSIRQITAQLSNLYGVPFQKN